MKNAKSTKKMGGMKGAMGAYDGSNSGVGGASGAYDSAYDGTHDREAATA